MNSRVARQLGLSAHDPRTGRTHHDRGPDFFIVGAPKSGTTALEQYLGRHPLIFMAPKELHFFGSDLTFRVKPHVPAEEYFAMFPPSDRVARCGEASVWYLYSSRAAAEIHAYNPAARIVVMLRHPADMLYSLHGHTLFEGGEDISDFREALAAEGDRREGRRIPPTCNRPWSLLYRDAARYSEQLLRYVTLFGQEQVHVILFDDFEADPASTYRKVLEFLGVDPAFTPRFEVLNPSRRIRSARFRHLTRSLNQPPDRLRRLVQVAVPSRRLRGSLKHRLASAMERANTRVAPRPPLDQRLRAELTAEFEPEVRSLEELLGRSLEHWRACPNKEEAVR